MGTVKIERLSIYKEGAWRRLNQPLNSLNNKADLEGQVYMKNYWRAFWSPDDGLFHNGNWYVIGSGGGTPDPDPEPTLKENEITLSCVMDNASTVFIRFKAEAAKEVASNLSIAYKVEVRTVNGSTSTFSFTIEIEKGKKEGTRSTSYPWFETTMRFSSATITPTSDKEYKYKVNNLPYQLLNY